MTENLELATGCWIDGHWGHFAYTRLIEIAQDYGYEISDDDEKAVNAYKANDDEFDGECGEKHNASEGILMKGGLMDELEEVLNKHVAREGFAFGWVDGELFYMNSEWFDQD